MIRGHLWDLRHPYPYVCVICGSSVLEKRVPWVFPGNIEKLNGLMGDMSFAGDLERS